jgi:REP element-mobilizing transposase RayT
MSRGADRQDIFSADVDFARFETLLGDVVEQFAIEVHAYALMTNHFHLIAHCPDAGLSGAMQSILSRYASGYDHFYERVGPLFTGRFVSVPITSDDQLATAGRYVHRNPLAFVPLRLLGAYRWSSYGVYIGHRSTPDWLSTDMLGCESGDTAVRYREFVETAHASDNTSPDGRPLVVAPTIDAIIDAVSTVSAVEPTALLRNRRRTPNDPRLVAVWAAVELRSAGTAEIATRFDLASQASVRATARRARVRSTHDGALRALMLQTMSELERPAR